MIDKIVSKESCLGCEACYNACPKNAISMAQNLTGFFVPVVNYSKCINCQRCIKVCPSLTKYVGIPILPSVYSARIRDKGVLLDSTSGGIFTAISDYILSNNGFICGSIYADDFVVHHIITKSEETRNKMRGAKYVQSSIGSCYKEIKKLLDGRENVLFVGTPCQVHALKLFLGKDYPTLLTIDMVCHGVPSPFFFANFLSFLKRKYGQIKAVRFRSKKHGWRGNNLEISFCNGKSLCNVRDTKKYTSLYGKGYLMRNCCFTCNYTTIFRIGDFSIGDYWGIENVSSNLNDNNGCSIIFVNNQKAKDCFEAIRPNLIVEARDIPEILQPNLLKPTEKPNDFYKIQQMLVKGNYWKKH